MNTELQAEILQQVTAARVQLWLHAAVGKNLPNLVPSARPTLAALADFAVSCLEHVTPGDASLERLLIDLYDARHLQGNEAIDELIRIRSLLVHGNGLVQEGDNVRRMKALEALVPPLLEEIRAASTLEEALPLLNALDQVCMEAWKALTPEPGQPGGEAWPSEEMNGIMIVFDHAFENLPDTYDRIHDGTYHW